jgi:hypothetical protein
MMERLIAVGMGAFLLTSNAYAFERAEKLDLKRAEAFARAAFNADTRVESKKILEGVCGASGPSFVLEVKVKKTKKSLNEKNGTVLSGESWEVVKTYIIPASKISSGRKALMDANACLE